MHAQLGGVVPYRPQNILCILLQLVVATLFPNFEAEMKTSEGEYIKAFAAVRTLYA